MQLQKVVGREEQKSILIYEILGVAKKPSLHETLEEHNIKSQMEEYTPNIICTFYVRL